MRPVGSTQSWLRLARQQPAQHLIGGPRDGRDRGDAEALVDQRAPRVVDPGDHVLDAVGLAGDPGAEDVGVVAVGHRREGSGLARSRLRRGDRGRSRSRRRLVPPKSAARRRNARPFLSTTATRVTGLLERAGELAADPATADDDDVHARPPVADVRRMLRPRQLGRRRATGIRVHGGGGNGMLTPGNGEFCDGDRRCSTASNECSSVARWRPPSKNTSASSRRSRSRSSPPTRSRRPRTRRRRSSSSSRSCASSLALGLSKLVPIAIAVAILLAIVTTSYRQTIFAYPSGGGSYIVSRENLGENPVARRGRVAARRLHPHRRGVDLGGCRRDRFHSAVQSAVSTTRSRCASRSCC